MLILVRLLIHVTRRVALASRQWCFTGKMPVPPRYRLLATCVSASLIAPILLAGCQGWPRKPAEAVSRVTASSTPSSESSAAKPASAALAIPNGWALTPRNTQDEGEPEWRWRHPGIDDYLAAYKPDKSMLQAAAQDPQADPVLATNAAITLARLGDNTGQTQLVAAVGNRAFGDPTRCAAAEALGRLEGPTVGDALRTLIDQFGDVSLRGRAAYRAVLHRELIAGLARHVDPADEPRMTAALKSPETEVRREAVLAWASGKKGSLPEAVADMTVDPDAPVRAAAMTAVGRRRHPEAVRLLASGARDMDIAVRRAAIAALGQYGGPEALKLLEGLLANRSEAIRAAAVSALAAAGVEDPVVKAVEDEAWQVRAAAARALGKFAVPRGEQLARRLLDDRSPLVKDAVVEMTDAWPVPQAGPILLTAMGNPSPALRRKAAERLASRWPPGETFSWRAPPERRAEGLVQLTELFNQQFGIAAPGDPQQAAAALVTAPTKADPAQVAQVDRALGVMADPRSASADVQRAKQSLIALGPALAPALDQLRTDKAQPLPDVIYSDVLPKVDPAFGALSRFGMEDRNERRRAASELARLATDRPLSHLAIVRLAEWMTKETDPLIWLYAFHAVASDASEPSLRLARLAIGHPSAEVRCRACAHLAAHPSPAHAPVLLPALEDPDQDVVQAAVKALVAGGRLENKEPLVRLLRTASPHVRVDVAAALAGFGDRSGVDELIRLAHHSDARIRHRTAEAMGRLADPRFTPSLIGLLDDHQTIRRVVLQALPTVTGHQLPPSHSGTPRSTTEQATAWKEWYRRR
ncbi:MAG: HEAT repeat domain-containing protein [Pirellulales bacterium]|nr:HEAT repeat domain-containing protein [Pirellulales bacterium]